jgi:hypothetical protein
VLDAIITKHLLETAKNPQKTIKKFKKQLKVEKIYKKHSQNPLKT